MTTLEGEELIKGVFRANSYAVAIGKGRFGGSIHVHFHGLGEVVGSIVPEQNAESGPSAEECDGSPPIVGATFRGRIHFRDPGSHGPWSARGARASITPQCGHLRRGFVLPKELFGALAEVGGPTLSGPPTFALFAHSAPRRRAIEFIAFGDDRPGFGGTFAAVDVEWLPGGVATRRVASRPTEAFHRSIEVDSARGQLNRAIFKPPAPFFGRGVYMSKTGKLRGSIGVRFLGLKLHLARPALAADLEDEDLR